MRVDAGLRAQVQAQVRVFVWALMAHRA